MKLAEKKAYGQEPTKDKLECQKLLPKPQKPFSVIVLTNSGVGLSLT